MAEVIPADRTVRALIIALLEMPMDAIVEVWPVGKPTREFQVASVAEQPSTGFGQEFVTLAVEHA